MTSILPKSPGMNLHEKYIVPLLAHRAHTLRLMAKLEIIPANVQHGEEDGTGKVRQNEQC